MAIKFIRSLEEAQNPYFQLIIVHARAVEGNLRGIEEGSVPELQVLLADSILGCE